MSHVDLRFVQSPGNSHLLFGGDQTGSSPPVDARLLATLPALTFRAQTIPNADFALVGSFPRLEMVAEGTYQSYTVRPTVGHQATDWQQTNVFNSGVEDRQQLTARSRVLGRALWADGRTHRLGIEDRHPGHPLRRCPATRRRPRCCLLRGQPSMRIWCLSVRTRPNRFPTRSWYIFL